MRQQNGEPPLWPWCLLQARERSHAFGDHGDAVRLRPIDHGREGQLALRRQALLESDSAREHAAIELGQHDVHGEIGGAEPARAVAPSRALGVCHHQLEHRHIRSIERGQLSGVRNGVTRFENR